MEKTIAILALAAIATSTHASNSDAYCEKIAQVADGVMEFRQIDMPMSYQLEEVPEGATIIREIILDAYDRPSYSTRAMRFEEQMKFRNAWHLDCLRAEEAWN